MAVSEVTARFMKSESAGFVLRQFGFVGRFAGNWPRYHVNGCLYIPCGRIGTAVEIQTAW